MNIVTSYFLVRSLPGAIQLGVVPQGTVSSSVIESRRQLEYHECLFRNCMNPHVGAVHVMVEGMDALHHLQHQMATSSGRFRWSAKQKAKIIPIMHLKGQPSYADLFTHANRLLSHQLVMVCNADVFLSPVLADGTPAVPAMSSLCDPVYGKVSLALTRYEMDITASPRTLQPLSVTAPLIHQYRGSHDAFVFRPPLPHGFVESVQHYQNAFQAENIVIHELQRHGYRVFNPSLSVQLIHRHEADIRQWYPSVDPSRYATSEPTTVHDTAASLSFAAAHQT